LQASKQVNTQSVSTKNMAMGGKKISFDQSEVLISFLWSVSLDLARTKPVLIEIELECQTF
jgi:hypothetical protein